MPKSNDLERTGVFMETATPIRAHIAELRRVTGLTLDELAACLGVNRRSVYFWMAGKRASAGDAERVHQFLAVMREVDQGSAAHNRAALRATVSGFALIEHVRDGDLTLVQEVLAPTANPRVRRPIRAQKAAARQATLPPPPVELLQAEDGIVEHERGPARRVIVRRVQAGDKHRQSRESSQVN